MKNYRTFLLLAGLSLIIGCKQKDPGPDVTRLSGTVNPPITGYITVAAGPVLDSARINKEGGFSIDIELKEPAKALVFIGKQITDVHLEPGKDLGLRIDLATFPDKVEYEGFLGPINHYLDLADRLDQRTNLDPAKLFAMLPVDFLRITDSIRMQKVTLLEEYAEKYPQIDTAFVKRTRKELDFSYADQCLQYPDRHLLLTGVYPALPEGYHQNLFGPLTLDDPGNLNSEIFKSFIQNYLDYKQEVYLAENPNTHQLVFPESVARFRVIHAEFHNPEIVDWLLFSAMGDHLANYGVAYVESFLTDFRIKCHNTEYREQIEKTVSILEKVGPGKEAPDFTAYTVDGKKVSLSSYFGKILYIGFWSSWSDWSLLEVPYFEALRKEFADKGITFILISLDFEKDKNKWIATVKQNRLGGVQLIQDPKSTVLKDQYYLNDFPRYFLIDKEGKIISAHAPRPVENVRVTLEKLISR